MEDMFSGIRIGSLNGLTFDIIKKIIREPTLMADRLTYDESNNELIHCLGLVGLVSLLGVTLCNGKFNTKV